MISSATARSAGAAPGHGHADFARVEQIVIVLRVADRRRCCESTVAARAARWRSPVDFADALRQHHEPAAVERQDQRLLKLAHRIEDRLSVRRVGLYHHLARDELHGPALELLDEGGRRRMRDGDVAAAGGELEHGAVFADHRVEAARGPPPPFEDPSSLRPVTRMTAIPCRRAVPMASRTDGSKVSLVAIVPS